MHQDWLGDVLAETIRVKFKVMRRWHADQYGCTDIGMHRDSLGDVLAETICATSKVVRRWHID